MARADILLVEGNAVRRYSDSGTFLSTFAHGLNSPLGITEADGHVFIGQYGSGEIHKYDAEGVDMGPILSGHPGWQPTGLAWNDGRLYAASAQYKGIASYAMDSLREDGDINTPQPQRILEGLAEPTSGLCSAGGRGGVYFTTSDETTGKGSLGYWSGQPGDPAQILHTFPEGSQPRGIVMAEEGFFVALMGSGKISKVDSKGKAEDWLTGLLQPVGLGIQAGRLYVSHHSDRTVKAYNLSDKKRANDHRGAKQPAILRFCPAGSHGWNQGWPLGVARR